MHHAPHTQTPKTRTCFVSHSARTSCSTGMGSWYAKK
jgi:hypothetical protein